MAEFVKWLFSDANGHFTLACVILAVCAAAAVFGVPHAGEAAIAVWPVVLVKLK